MTDRTRTYTWNDPRDVAREIIGRDHLEWMRAMKNGEIPAAPFAQTLGIEMETIEPGRIVFSARTAEWMSNPAGIIHGGLIATILDSVVTLAVMSQLPADKLCTTLHLNTHYVRPLFPKNDSIVAEGLAIHIGTTIGTAEARVRDTAGRLIAHGTASLAIINASTLHRE